MIYCEVSKDNLLDVIHPKTTKEQENYVALNAKSIAVSDFFTT